MCRDICCAALNTHTIRRDTAMSPIACTRGQPPSPYSPALDLPHSTRKRYCTSLSVIDSHLSLLVELDGNTTYPSHKRTAG